MPKSRTKLKADEREPKFDRLLDCLYQANVLAVELNLDLLIYILKMGIVEAIEASHRQTCANSERTPGNAAAEAATQPQFPRRST